MARYRLYLTSGSPRRRRLLEQIGISPHVRPTGVDERGLPGESPRDAVARLAEAKARHAATQLGAADPPGVVLAADTAVVIDDRALGKPRNDSAAEAMLRDLRGRTHEVLTGVFLMRTDDGRCHVGVEATRVHFRDYDDARIRAYVATGEPRDKAGAYAIQGRGALLVQAVEGSWSNVVGLPLERLAEWLQPLDVRLADLLDW